MDEGKDKDIRVRILPDWERSVTPMIARGRQTHQNHQVRGKVQRAVSCHRGLWFPTTIT